ncbi:hypothetical protein LT679_02525 [Mucilaginibacter roseus]|uniref:Glycosyltransferase RgtA/B/C/D-like domain-containing protein n=1 Tax=Mucilaginibacter roseus TaxID=1528868 RepID=A0ABS8TX62_9SPHI|nr:hypothetical protein [Mucilaginibacter roseus]MCD8739465.1 hypothetical protein [Mucilaginibacter roseus]
MPKTRYLKHLDTLLFAIAGYFAVYFFTKYSGVGISPDSIMYASAAESIYKHGNLITFNGSPLTFFPVFYPAVLSLSFLFGVDAIKAGPVINGLLFGGVLLLTGYCISRFKKPSVLYKWLVLAAILLSPALLEIYSYLWSETLFIFLTILFVPFFKRYLDSPRIKHLLYVAVVAGLCCITRYAGITVITTGCLMILANAKPELKKRFVHITLFGFAGLLPLIINLLVNYFSSGYSTGTRKPSVTTFGENLHYFGVTICGWLGLTEAAYSYGAMLSALILIALTARFIWQVKQKQINRYETIFLSFAIVYATFILVIASVSRFEQLNSRLLSPMYVPLLLACTDWVPGAIVAFKNNSRKWMAAVAVIIMAGFLYNLTLIDLKRYDDEFEYGVPGYSDDDWNTSPFISFQKKNKHIYKPGIPVYSDADEAVYFFTGGHAKLVPQKFFTADVAKFSQQKKFYLVWFNAMANAELISIADIEKQFRVKKLYGFDDGAIYLMEKP